MSKGDRPIDRQYRQLFSLSEPPGVASPTETTGLRMISYPDGTSPATYVPSQNVLETARRHQQIGR